MIEMKQGDILRANAEALVNTVNCVGVMGRGLALQFKKVFPDNFLGILTSGYIEYLNNKKTCDMQWNQLKNWQIKMSFQPAKAYYRAEFCIRIANLKLFDFSAPSNNRHLRSPY